ncbi:hypothetical protein Fcan01_26966 [Folsomia candida]|uniref:Uncharacterized protein n=1 Tax=Folsomia candida TaxID=158441 RepID=A0A226CYY5_FOLCA|nr:hypothetical protein Fcan01_26966 [Folsomia candida]
MGCPALNLLNLETFAHLRDTPVITWINIRTDHATQKFGPCLILPSEIRSGLIFSPTPDEAFAISNPVCVTDTFLRRPYPCYTSHLTLGIISRKLNISMEGTDEPVPDETIPHAFHICILCHPTHFLEEIDQQNPTFYVDQNAHFRIIYCYVKPSFEPPTFSMLINPFPGYIWGLLFATVGMVGLLGKNVSNSVSLCNAFIAQSPAIRFRQFHITFLSLIFIFFSILYLDSVTTEVISPYEQKPILTNEAWYSEGKYKLILGSEHDIDGFARYLGIPKKYWKSAIKIVKGFHMGKMQNDPFGTLSWLGEQTGAFIMIDLLEFREILFETGYKIRLGNTTCVIIKESLSVKMRLWTLRLRLADKVRQSLERLRSSGIPKRWTGLTTRLHVKWFFDEKIKLENTTRTEFIATKNLPPIRLNLASKPKIVFLLHVYLIMGAALFNIFEICMKFG